MSDKHGAKALTVVDRTQPPAQLHPMVELAMRGGQLDTVQLEKLMELQERWEAATAEKAYSAALVALKRELPAIVSHDKTVDFGSKNGRVHYTHASMAKVIEQIEPHLGKHGFAQFHRPGVDGNKVSVTCVVLHEQGHSEEFTLSSPIDTSGSKNPAQGVASTISFLRRYTTLCAFGLATRDTGEAGVHEPHDEPESDSPGADGQEHAPEPKREAVDRDRNLTAVERLKKLGIACDEAEAFIGKKVAEWTPTDLGKLQAWAKERSTKKSEPPHDPKTGEVFDLNYFKPKIAESKTERQLDALWVEMKAAKCHDADAAAAMAKRLDEIRAAGRREPGQDG